MDLKKGPGPQPVNLQQVGGPRVRNRAAHGDNHHVALLQNPGVKHRLLHRTDLRFGVSLDIDPDRTDPGIKRHAAAHAHEKG